METLDKKTKEEGVTIEIINERAGCGGRSAEEAALISKLIAEATKDGISRPDEYFMMACAG